MASPRPRTGCSSWLPIFVFLHRVLVPQGLGIFVPIAAACLALTAAIVWFRALARFWSRPMAWRQFKPGRVTSAALAAAVCLGAFLLIPLPCRIRAPGVLEPAGALRVYVSTPGTLESAAVAGQRVSTGDVIAQLEDEVLRREIQRLSGEERVAQIRVNNLQARLADEPDAAAQLQVAEEMLADVREQLRQRKQDEKALTLVAPGSGIGYGAARSAPRIKPMSRTCQPGPELRWKRKTRSAIWSAER